MIWALSLIVIILVLRAAFLIDWPGGVKRDAIIIGALIAVIVAVTALFVKF